MNNDKIHGAVADKLGISKSTMHAILRQGLMPTLKLAYEIEKYTCGAITVYDWLDQKQDITVKTTKTKIKEKQKAIK